MNTVDILVVVLIVVRIIIGVTLHRTAQATHQRNLAWLGLFYFSRAIYDALSFPTLMESTMMKVIQNVVTSISFIPLAIFIWQTFYKQQKITPAILVGVTGLFSIGGLVYSFIALNGNYSDLIMAYVFSGMLPLTNWAWHAWASARAYLKINNDPNVEDWVKWRYQAMVAYSLVLFGTAIVGSFAANPDLLNSVVYIGTALNLIAIGLQFLVWVMPESFRQWLNRNQQMRAEEQIYGQAQAVLNIIGSAMCEGTGLTKIATVYAIRTAIGQKINIQDSKKIEAHVVSMGYDAWSAFLDSPELYTLIQNALPTIRPHAVIQKGKRALAEKQSLFTLQTR